VFVLDVDVSLDCVDNIAKFKAARDGRRSDGKRSNSKYIAREKIEKAGLITSPTELARKAGVAYATAWKHVQRFSQSEVFDIEYQKWTEQIDDLKTINPIKAAEFRTLLLTEMVKKQPVINANFNQLNVTKNETVHEVTQLDLQQYQELLSSIEEDDKEEEDTNATAATDSPTTPVE